MFGKMLAKNLAINDLNQILYKGKPILDHYLNDWILTIHAHFNNAEGHECCFAFMPNSDEFLIAFDMSIDHEESNRNYLEVFGDGGNTARFKVDKDMKVIIDSIRTINGRLEYSAKMITDTSLKTKLARIEIISDWVNQS